MHVLGTPEDLEFFHNHVLPRFGSKPIALCADHSGLDLKSRMKSRLEHHNIPYIDFGTYSTSDCDHHDFLSQVVRHIHEGMCDFGMAFCRTGQGFNIAANKARGIRSALVFDDYTARMSVHHNAANMFCLPSKYVDSDETADRIIAALFVSSFDGGRHATRIRKIEEDTELFG
jgi:ribose 5-phosphate isomerase B